VSVCVCVCVFVCVCVCVCGLCVCVCLYVRIEARILKSDVFVACTVLDSKLARALTFYFFAFFCVFRLLLQATVYSK
jgi:hypothetical protein